ncbi:carboxylesterase/lipase family protein [Deinococcus sp.]|uniref:carboxylesterase/lipase family protein n=1 Tax=Deinococcus sp. TaxID=47478 RepID=UPI0025DF60BE|nr:carboxylesterase/lipase family protein [Deinococcus sp.]
MRLRFAVTLCTVLVSLFGASLFGTGAQTAASPAAAQNVSGPAQSGSTQAGSTQAPSPVPDAPQPRATTLPAAPGTLTQARVAQGLLGGRENGGVRRFFGVPFAQPPLGLLRWAPPQPPTAWPGRRDASRFADVCLQPPNPLDPSPDRRLRGQEDCLYLNVYAPVRSASEGATQTAATVRPLPVMVWIHGGSFTTGSGNIYDASLLAREQNVVVVTLNYRLGALGFLAAPALGPQSGNYALQDLLAALKWVKENAAAFGGDPGNVTAFGESAGAIMLCDLLTSPASQGLFQRAIVQSGPCAAPLNTVPLAQALSTGAAFTGAFNCSPLVAGCLRLIPASTLIETAVPGSRAPGTVALPPLYGDALIPRKPYDAYQGGLLTKVPLLIGGNRDEGTPFTAYLTPPRLALNTPLYWGLISALKLERARAILQSYPGRAYPTNGLAAAAVVTDGLFACPVYSVITQAARFVPTYAYEFSDPQAVSELKPTASVPKLGAYHASELISVFGTPLTGLADPAAFSPAQTRLARQMRTYWANFARSGDPNGAGQGTWAPFDPQLRNLLSLSPAGNTVISDFAERHRCAFWNELDGR